MQKRPVARMICLNECLAREVTGLRHLMLTRQQAGTVHAAGLSLVSRGGLSLPGVILHTLCLKSINYFKYILLHMNLSKMQSNTT